MSKIPRFFGITMREWRIKAGLTQRDVSTGMNYTTAQFVSNWERGVSTPPTKDFPRLSEVLRIRESVLIHLYFDMKMEMAKREHSRLWLAMKERRRSDRGRKRASRKIRNQSRRAAA